MRQLLLTFITFCILVSAHAQKKSWPNVNYIYARAFMYNLNSDLNNKYQIIKDGKIDKRAVSTNKNLTKNQLQTAVKLVNKPTQGLLAGLSKCFNPHHAIVFYNSDNKPVASIMLDFDCEAIRLQPQKTEKPLKHELSQKEINKQLEILNAYKSIIKQLNYPVFNNIEDYRNYYVSNKPSEYPKLQLIGKNGIKQLQQDKEERFDLSGICKLNNKIYVVADKKWNNFIYRLDTTAANFRVYPEKELCPDTKIDFEGIDVCDNQLFLIEEWFDNVLSVNDDSCNLTKHPVYWKRMGIDPTKWGNKGLEGIACDNEHSVLYLAKEREPRRIFKIDLKMGTFTEPFIDVLTKKMKGHDISDMKYENGYLYILERSTATIVRVDVKTKHTKSYSFKYIVFKNGQRIFTNKFPQYGMAESLLLTKDQIWVGLDNNGDKVSEYGKSLGLKENNNTVIFIFKRPKGF